MSGRTASRRFRATIDQAGVNPFVAVPERVSQAFAPWARAGRISVTGTLNGVPIRTTLVPARRDGHRLYVDGGMRAAAGVAVGDRVSFALRPTGPDEVDPPADVVAALDALPGARDAFAALGPSHRRELLRYVDDARTPRGRARRISRLTDHVRGTQPPRRQERAGQQRAGQPTAGQATAGRAGAERPLWLCPRCGNGFVNRNQYHSCARHDLDEPFAGKPAEIRQLFDRLRTIVETFGPTTVQAYRDRVAFMSRVRFAGATPRQRWLTVEFWLTHRLDSPRVDKIETIYPDVHIHTLRIASPDQLDTELAGWLAEAAAVGRQEHLGPARSRG